MATAARTFTAPAQDVILDLGGSDWARIEVTGAFTGTLTPQVSRAPRGSAAVWDGLGLLSRQSGQIVNSITAPGTYYVPAGVIAPTNLLRLTCSALSAGTPAVAIHDHYYY